MTQHPAFSHKPITPDVDSRAFLTDDTEIDLNDRDQSVTGLAMDLLVAEVLRRKIEGFDGDPLKLEIIVRRTARFGVTARALRVAGSFTVDPIETPLLTNLITALLLIEQSRKASALAVPASFELRVIVPTFSMHDALRLEALEPGVLLPPFQGDEDEASQSKTPPGAPNFTT